MLTPKRRYLQARLRAIPSTCIEMPIPQVMVTVGSHDKLQI
jgi:hypothetical protein